MQFLEDSSRLAYSMRPVVQLVKVQEREAALLSNSSCHIFCAASLLPELLEAASTDPFNCFPKTLVKKKIVKRSEFSKKMTSGSTKFYTVVGHLVTITQHTIQSRYWSKPILEENTCYRRSKLSSTCRCLEPRPGPATMRGRGGRRSGPGFESLPTFYRI